MTAPRRRGAILALASLTSLGMLAGGATAHSGGGKHPHPGSAYTKWAKSMDLGGKQRAWSADPDKDGLRNWSEYRAGTNPKDRDSDDDRVSDAFEDRDRDGLTNGHEDRSGTDCRSRDRLEDLDDGEIEVKGRVVSYLAPSATAPGSLVMAFAGSQSTLVLPQGARVSGASLLVAGAFVKVEIEREDGGTDVKVRSRIDGGSTTGGTTTGGTTTGGTTTSDDDKDD